MSSRKLCDIQVSICDTNLPCEWQYQWMPESDIDYTLILSTPELHIQTTTVFWSDMKSDGVCDLSRGNTPLPLIIYWHGWCHTYANHIIKMVHCTILFLEKDTMLEFVTYDMEIYQQLSSLPA